MNVRPLTGFIFSLCVAVLAGWFFVDLSANSIAVNNPEWLEVGGFAAYEIDGEDYIDRLRRSGAIALSAEEEAAIVAPEEQELTADGIPIPPLPAVLGASRVDGEYQIYFRNDAQEKFTAKIGDKLEGGWELVSADMKTVVASFAGETRNINVVNYGDYSIPEDERDEEVEPQ